MHRRPVAGVGGVDEDVAVQTHLLAVVLADVRVKPVQAGVRERYARGEAAADRDRRLRLVRAVVAVLQPQAVPMHGRFQIAVVDDVDLDLRALGDAEIATLADPTSGTASGGVPAPGSIVVGCAISAQVERA